MTFQVQSAEWWIGSSWMERRQHKDSSHVEDSIYSISAGSKPIWHTHTKRYKGKNEPKQELKIYKYEGGFRNIQTHNADVRAIILIQDAQIGQNTIQNSFRSKNVIYRWTQPKQKWLFYDIIKATISSKDFLIYWGLLLLFLILVVLITNISLSATTTSGEGNPQKLLSFKVKTNFYKLKSPHQKSSVN